MGAGVAIRGVFSGWRVWTGDGAEPDINVAAGRLEAGALAGTEGPTSLGGLAGLGTAAAYGLKAGEFGSFASSERICVTESSLLRPRTRASGGRDDGGAAAGRETGAACACDG